MRALLQDAATPASHTRACVHTHTHSLGAFLLRGQPELRLGLCKARSQKRIKDLIFHSADVNERLSLDRGGGCIGIGQDSKI